MNIKHLATLPALAAIDRLSSFTGAAQELGISQAAVSMQIARMENDLNVMLVERTTRSVVLSAEGKRLIEAINRPLAEIELALNDVRNRQNSGLLTVEVLSSIASKWLIPRLKGFHEQNPDLTVSVTIQDNQTQTLGADVDVGIRIANTNVPGMHSEFLTSEAIFPVCAPDVARAFREDMEGTIKSVLFLDDKMALNDGSGCNWAEQWAAFGMDDTARRPSMVFDRADLAIEAAISGQGIALGRTFISLDDIQRHQLVTPFDKVTKLRWSYYLVCRASVIGWPKVIRFKKWLLQELHKSQKDSKLLNLWID